MIYDDGFYGENGLNRNYTEKLEYIPPQSIGEFDITDNELKALRRVLGNDKWQLDFILGITIVLIFEIVNYIYGNKLALIAILTIVLGFVGIEILFYRGDKSFRDRVQAGFRGRVVAKETLNKLVGTHGDNELRPYYYDSGMKDKKQTYYYITVETEEKYKAVRHISCTQQHYDRLKFGDRVTVVYLGEDFLVGFISEDKI